MEHSSTATVVVYNRRLKDRLAGPGPQTKSWTMLVPRLMVYGATSDVQGSPGAALSVCSQHSQHLVASHARAPKTRPSQQNCLKGSTGAAHGCSTWRSSPESAATAQGEQESSVNPQQGGSCGKLSRAARCLHM